MMSMTSLMGMAKPMPSMVASELDVLPLLDSLAEVMPTTRPYWSNRGPPELPLLMVQSVWIMFITVPSLMVTERPVADTVPEV